jgi:hypothetical protein
VPCPRGVTAAAGVVAATRITTATIITAIAAAIAATIAAARHSDGNAADALKFRPDGFPIAKQYLAFLAVKQVNHKSGEIFVLST